MINKKHIFDDEPVCCEEPRLIRDSKGDLMCNNCGSARPDLDD